MEIINPYEAAYDEDYFRRLHNLNTSGNNPYREAQRLLTIEACRPGRDDTVLELGCGTGLYCRMLSPRVKRMIGVDYSPATIERAKAQTPQANIEYVLAGIQKLTMFPDHTFDKMISIDVFEHINDEQLAAVLSEVKRLLKPGGVLAFFTPCRSHWIEQLKDKNIILKQFEEHIGVRTEAEYRRFSRQAGLQVKEVLRFETCLPGLRVVERLVKQAPLMGALFVSRLGITVTTLD
ncbi:MAG: class I SAM-dependent methyltransferase [Anaerolineae bacterium]|nr:class I SAM-dependent methyltransferase [Anaerolineae bacterium]